MKSRVLNKPFYFFNDKPQFLKLKKIIVCGDVINVESENIQRIMRKGWLYATGLSCLMGMKKEGGFFITLHVKLQLNQFEFCIYMELTVY